MIINEENYVDMAEKAMKELCSAIGKNGKAAPVVTTSKIRNLLSMVSDIYNDVLNEKNQTLSSAFIGRINYMKIRFYYEAGREPLVKEFLLKAKVLDIIDRIGNSRKNFLLFSQYMEALVAFRKFYGKNDD